MPELVLTMGTPRSGKTTLTKRWPELVWYNADALMESQLSPAQLLETKITEVAYPLAELETRAKIVEAIRAGKSLGVDDTQYDVIWVLGCLALAREYNYYPITLARTIAPINICLERNAREIRRVDPDRIREINEQMDPVWNTLYPLVDRRLLIPTGLSW